MKIREKQILDYCKKRISLDIQGFKMLHKGDLNSIFQLFCCLAEDKKADFFITNNPLLLANRHNIAKNWGLRILSPDEFMEIKKDVE